MPPSTTGSSISDRARNGAAADPQDGLFDREVNDTNLEGLLDDREAKRKTLSTAKTKFKEKDDLVKARLSEFELADGEVARVGKYRIERKKIVGGHRSFDVGDSHRLNISLFEEG